jgi:hypothetical protein
MKRDFIFDIYRKVKEARDRELHQILNVLRPKAISDPEIRDALRILESWSRTNDATTEDGSDKNGAE